MFDHKFIMLPDMTLGSFGVPEGYGARLDSRLEYSGSFRWRNDLRMRTITQSGKQFESGYYPNYKNGNNYVAYLVPKSIPDGANCKNSTVLEG